MTVFEERTRRATYGKDISLKDTNAINTVKNSSANTIYPKKDHYTLLLVSNLAYPQRFSVDCSKPILHHIICVVNETRRALRNSKENTNILSCSNVTVKHNSRCHMFKWFNGANESSQSFYEKCLIHKMTAESITDLQIFNFILEATSIVRFKFLSELSMNSINMFSYEKIWLQVTHASQIVDKKFASGYYICYGKTKYMKFDQQILYKYNNNIFISALHVCDRSSNCEYIKSDEMECSCTGFNKHCREICNGQACSCSPLYFRSHNGKCLRYAFQKFKKLDTTENIWKYKSNKRSIFIDSKLQDDLVPDYGNNSEYENLLPHILKNKTIFCKVSGKLPCQGGDSECYDLHFICIYRLNEFSHLIPCTTGSHIEECKTFQCNQMFKCPEYYCIPWGYVCNWKWDCPHGYDESIVSSCQINKK